MFVVIEGPNGVGKSTVARELTERLAGTGEVSLTTEPTGTELGRLLRSAEASLSGRRYALAFAADRLGHIEDEIVPLLAKGRTVVSDRYVQSSLVLQRIDGLPLEEVWSYNRFVLKPDLSVYLDDDPAVTGARLAARAGLSRLEELGSPELEVELYQEARAMLDGLGWRQTVINCRGRSPAQVVDAAVMALASVSAVPRPWSE